jgi:hypothetical protein
LILIKLKKKDLIKQDEKRKVIMLIYKLINDNQTIEAGFILYKKNKIIKYVMTFLIKYYMKCFNDKTNIDILF